jgi:hypothetical protein
VIAQIVAIADNAHVHVGVNVAGEVPELALSEGAQAWLTPQGYAVGLTRREP